MKLESLNFEQPWRIELDLFGRDGLTPDVNDSMDNDLA